jgi:hypothetical protein
MYTRQAVVLIEPGETTDWGKSSPYAQMPVRKEKWKQWKNTERTMEALIS